ncbi:MAG: alpha-amylase [Aquincola sp.]|nr:alpha-amylase [Aquincola sp.]
MISRAFRPFRALRASLRSLAFVVIAAIAAPAAHADAILHAFNWRYADVQSRADQIRDAGYRIVLVSPAYKSEGGQWWARYQPQDFRLIHNPLGDTTAFRNMVTALQQRGVRVYADIVMNHMANEAFKRSDLNYPGSAVLSTYASNTGYYNGIRLFGDLRYNVLSGSDFGPAQCINNYNDVWQVQNWRLCGGSGDAGLPDLIGNSYVIGQQQQYLTALKNLGVRGFRIDAAKHMPASYINAVLTPTIKSGMHVFGEVITSGGAGNGEYDRFLAPYLRDTDHSAYDFPLHNQMRSAFGFGGRMSQLVDPLAFGQALQPTRAITFTVTHDIPNNGGFRYLIMDPTDETLAYAYIFGRNGGVPMLYSDNNESGDNRWVNAWNRSDLKAMVRFHNTAQGSDQQVLASGDCHLIFRRGNRGIVAINKCGNSVSVPVNMNNSVLWWNTDYRDALDSSNVVRISSGTYTFNLPPRRARMWLR